MMTLRMGWHRDLPAGDPMGRTAMGWEPGLSAQECWDRTRGLWLLDERRVLAEDTVLLVDPDWVVRAKARITGITKYGEKRAIEGFLVRSGGLGQPSPVRNASQNSVAYWPGI